MSAKISLEEPRFQFGLEIFIFIETKFSMPKSSFKKSSWIFFKLESIKVRKTAR